MTKTKAIPIPKLTSDQMLVCNQFIGLHRDLSVVIGNETFRLRFLFSPKAVARSRRPVQTIRLDVGGFPARIELAWADNCPPLSDLLGDASLADLPPEARAAVIASLFEPVLDQLAETCGEDVSLGQTDLPDRPNETPLCVGFSLAHDGRPAARGRIALSNELLPTLAAMADCEPAVACNDLSEVPVAAAVEVGNVSLPLCQMRAISPFDVLIMDTMCQDEEDLVARMSLQPAMVCSAKISESFLTINEIDSWLPREPWEEEFAVAVEDAPVELTFDAGQLRLPLEQWAELEPGMSLPFARNRFLCVRAAGRIVGRAEPVRMGNQFCARLLEWTATPHAFIPPKTAANHAEHDMIFPKAPIDDIPMDELDIVTSSAK